MHGPQELKAGRQVAYIPPHVRDSHDDNVNKMLRDKDTEFGFISSWRGNIVFCRFWNKFDSNATLRTLSTSEGCRREDLELYNYHPQEYVENTLKMLRADPLRYGWTEGAK